MTTRNPAGPSNQRNASPLASAVDDRTIDEEDGAERIEPENVEGNDGSDAGQQKEPFDPTKVRIHTPPMTIDLLVKRIAEGEIDLAPDFQRQGGLWSDTNQSRLIESLLIRIPIPAFYMDASNEEKWLVVDGLQRLTVLKRFIVDAEKSKGVSPRRPEPLRLTGMEFFRHLEGKSFDELPRPMQRRIMETSVIVYLIQPGTPAEVKFNVFRRINTGGLPLTPQEIRHALNQNGEAPGLLTEMAELGLFRQTTQDAFRDNRMTDRECVLRYLAFRITPPEEYDEQDLEAFLNNQMTTLNERMRQNPALRDSLIHGFERALKSAKQLFDKHAFRKQYALHPPRRRPINKPLFEAWLVNLEKLSDRDLDQLRQRKTQLLEAWVGLMNDGGFESAITNGTGARRQVLRRFAGIARILEETLSDSHATGS